MPILGQNESTQTYYVFFFAFDILIQLINHLFKMQLFLDFLKTA